MAMEARVEAAGRPALRKFMSPLDAWAVAFGIVIGWGSFSMPGTTFVPLAGPAGAVLGVALSALVMLVIGANYGYLMSRRSGLGGLYAYAKEAFGTDQAFICTWFLLLSYISILFLNATALFVLSRILLRGLLLSTPSYVLGDTRVYLGEVALSVATLLISGLAFMIHKPALQRLQPLRDQRRRRLGMQLLARAEAAAHNRLDHVHIGFLQSEDLGEDAALLKYRLGRAVARQVQPVTEIHVAGGQLDRHMLHRRRDEAALQNHVGCRGAGLPGCAHCTCRARPPPPA